ncbi:MAG: hypothetical protein AB4290_12760 [Spirulina sp.]
MSRTVWNILGVLTILAAIVFFSRYPERLAVLPPDRHFQLIAGGVFFAILLCTIACICFFPKTRPVTLPILGFYCIVAVILNGLGLLDVLRQKEGFLCLHFWYWLLFSISMFYLGRITGGKRI